MYIQYTKCPAVIHNSYYYLGIDTTWNIGPTAT